MSSFYKAPPLPSAFIWRRAHSFTGLWLVLFLIEHLLTNSQAALFIGNDGAGFVRAVNWLQDLPYLQVIEITLLGIPFLIHGIWGVKYLMTSQSNLASADGTTASLPKYPLNHAYTWQRITSWILLVGIIAHVVHMRFLVYPDHVQRGSQKEYVITVKKDAGLYTLSKRLDFNLYTSKQIDALEQNFLAKHLVSRLTSMNLDNKETEFPILKQEIQQEKEWLSLLKKQNPESNQIVAVSKSFGLAELLIVRETFKNPLMIVLYTGLVLATCFHAFNGLWTFMISWGVTLTFRSQQVMRKIAVTLMVLIACLGLSAIWGTYWFNLMH